MNSYFPDTIEVTAGTALFAFTLLVIALHAIEWFHIVQVRRLPSEESSPLDRMSRRSSILKRGMGVETGYYLLTFGFLIVFFRSIFLLVALALLAFLHFVGYQKLVPQIERNLLSKLATRRVVGFIVFDVVELFVLVILCVELYPYVFSLV